MRKALAAAGIVLALGAAGAVLLAAKETVREPAVAGAFYPAGRAELVAAVDGYLAAAGHRQETGRLLALIAPHAGYVYSGQVAAFSYRHINDRPVDTVILIGASHYASYSGAAVSPDSAWRTPLGDVRINGKLARSLLNEKAGVTANREAFGREHSLEVQLPFLLPVSWALNRPATKPPLRWWTTGAACCPTWWPRKSKSMPNMAASFRRSPLSGETAAPSARRSTRASTASAEDASYPTRAPAPRAWHS